MAAKGLNLSVPVVGNNTISTTHRDEEGMMVSEDGMLTRKKDDGGGGVDRSIIKIKISHGSNQFDLAVPSLSTFGDVKGFVAEEIGLEPKKQRLLFRGKEKEDQEYLQMAGVKDNAKVLLMEDPTIEAKDLQEVKGTEEVSIGGGAVAEVHAEVDKLSEQISAVQATIHGGTQVQEKEIIYLTEMLMHLLLKLDGIEAEGEGKVQRKMEVRRIQGFVETMDTLKVKNSNMLSTDIKTVPATTQWETFESGVETGALHPMLSAKVDHEGEQTQWAMFESGVGSNASHQMPSAQAIHQVEQPQWPRFKSGIGSNAPGPVPSAKVYHHGEQPRWAAFESGVGSSAPHPIPSVQVTHDMEQRQWATFRSGIGNNTPQLVPSAKVIRDGVQTHWATFESGVGSVNIPTPLPRSTEVAQVCDQPHWKTFESDVGGHNVPSHLPSSTKVTHDWEQFD